MDDELFEALYQIAHRLWPSREKRVQVAGRTVVLMYLWSVIRRKPRQWVCDPRNLPRALADRPILSRSQFGRRLNSPAIRAMLAELERHLRGTPPETLLGCWLLDAKPLLVSPYSKDTSARWGWAYNGKARGYKLYAMSDLDGHVVDWQVQPMNEAESVVAQILIQKTDRPGYLVGDSAYDSSPLHEQAAQRDLQLIAPRKRPHTGLGACRHHDHRLHAIAMLESIHNRFGPSMYEKRTVIERTFSRLGASPVGLDSLPPFVRTPPRVTLWAQGLLILYAFLRTKDLRQ